jgi:hypothetical protein
MKRRFLTLGACALGLMSFGAAPASAETVQGICSIRGTATFNPKIGGIPQQASYSFVSDFGTCTGTLDGQFINAKTVVATVSGTGLLSCTAAEGTGGTGSLRFPNTTPDISDDPTINFVNFDFVAAAGTVEFKADGAEGGTGGGLAQFLTNSSIATISQCQQNQVSSLMFSALLTAPLPFSG